MWLILWVIVVVVGVFISAPTPQKQTGYYGMPMIQGNTLIGISPIEFPHTQVLASKIVDCESGGNNNAIGMYGERGIAQFKKKTFDWMTELSGLNGEWLNEEDQWELLLWALDNGYEKHWVCYNLVINN